MACFFVASRAGASNELKPEEEYQKKIKSASVVSPLKGEIFGEDISLYDRSATFRATDVDIPGNSDLPVQIGRGFKVTNRRGDEFLPGFSDWEIDLPRVYGEFLAGKGWVTSSNAPTARCSIPGRPDAAVVHEGTTLSGSIDEIWHGYYLHVPGAGEQELLVDNQSKLPAMQDGVSHPWITSKGWRLGCLSSTANGYGGEGFFAVSTTGIKYYFDYAVTVKKKGYTYNFGGSYPNKSFVDRSEVSLLATRVEDRFGNWVKYNYAEGKLVSIQANDGRAITLSYDSNGNITKASANGRAWTYAYEWTTGYTTPSTSSGSYRLKSVTNPDGSQWTYTVAAGNLLPIRDFNDEKYNCTMEPDEFSGNFSLQVGHPSGANGLFKFVFGRQHMNHAPMYPCQGNTRVAVPTPWVPAYFDGYILTEKRVWGPGISEQAWTYVGDEPRPLQYYTSGTATDPCPTCTPSKDVKVTNPDGTATVYTFGFMYGLNAGRLLGVSRLNASGSVLSSEVDSYVADDEVSSQPFPAEMGGTLLHFSNPLTNVVRPLRSKRITQDGVTYVATTGSYDAWARSLSTTRSNTLGQSRSDAETYYDDLRLWVMGQTASSTNSDTGLVVSAQQFDPGTAQPTKSYSYGLLYRTYAYNGDGTVAAISDGNGNTTGLPSWKRGVPQSIQFADGTGRSATVDDNGWITAVTDENGYVTGYGYDAMGRISSVNYPGGDSTGWNATSQTFEQVDSSEYGIAASHWRQTTATGDARKRVYYDAYWRPLLTHEYDAANAAGTQRFQRFAYDYEGRTTFSSYKGSSDGMSIGTWTEYDALGRVTSSSQDSEQGVLTTLTEYQDGATTRVTNPRGFPTVTQYQAFDAPDYDHPLLIQHPEGAYTEIARDVLGSPTSITRRDASGGTSVVRSYVYDRHHRLCKTVEPETGATVTDYDVAGNVIWSASGLDLPSTMACNVADVAADRKVARGYDARNRLTSLSYPDGTGNQAWTYAPDGLTAQVTTYNANGGDAVVNGYAYNKRRLLTDESVSQPGWYSWSLGYGYDANGALASLLYPSGMTLNYAPNALGQPTQAGSYATAVSYYPNGAIKQFTYGNGIVHTMQQNARQLPAHSTDSGGANPLDLGISYDAGANVTALDDYTSGARQTRSMTYDGLDRLLTTRSAMFGGDNMARQSYDVLDNLTALKVGGKRDYLYAYNARQQLETVTNASGGAAVIGLGYDARGNLGNRNGVRYRFDLGNRLREVDGVESYRYDAHGRRVQANSPNLGNIFSFYGHDGELFYQRDERTAVITQYVSLGGSLIARVKSSALSLPPSLSVPPTSTTGSYAVAWSSVSGATGYQLQEQANGGGWSSAASGTGTGYAVTGKTSGSYGYRVRSCLNANCGDWSATATVSVLLAPSGAPALSVPSSNSSGSYSITWTTVADASSYTLEESSNGGASWSTLQSMAATSMTVSDKGTATYVYRVKACNNTGCGGYSASASTAVDRSAPAATGFDDASYRYYVTSGKSKSLTYYLVWATVARATRYEITGAVNYSGTGNTGAGSSSAWIKVSPNGSGGTVQVRACNENGCSAWSAAYKPVLDSIN